MSVRLAGWVFGALVVASFFVLLFWIGKGRWFLRDEWIFLTDRQGLSIDTLFRPHQDHWTTLPILVFQGLWNTVGLHSYKPYEALIIAMHLGVATLLRVIMRRVGVGPWVATCAAATFLLFGPGDDNILWAFQITMVGSLLFGLVQLILSDHDGRIDRRDWFGLLAGLAALMCSGVAPAMVAVVGMAALLRRGWRAALFHTVPLGVIYSIWYLSYRSTIPPNPRGVAQLPVVFDWVRSSVSGSFVALGHFTIVGIALAGLLIAGLAIAWMPMPFSEFRKRAAAPGALLIGGVILFASIPLSGRWIFGEAFAQSHRYLYLGAALALPALGVAADAVARSWRPLTPMVLGLLLIGIPWNIKEFDKTVYSDAYFASQQRFLLATPSSPLAGRVPGTVRPDPSVFVGSGLDVQWLLAAKAAGKVPDEPIDPALNDELTLRLGISQSEPSSPPATCALQSGPIDISPKKGAVWTIDSPIGVALVGANGQSSPPVYLDPANGQQLTIGLDGLTVRLLPGVRAHTYQICT